MANIRDMVSQATIAGLILLFCSKAIAGEITPEDFIREAKRVDFLGRSFIDLENMSGAKAVRMRPQRSATGLYKEISLPAHELRRTSWTWKVVRIHKTADLRFLHLEDVAASIMFVFGHPSFFKRNVPTLVYTWSSTAVPNGTVIQSSRYSSLRYIQLRGTIDQGQTFTEFRDVEADFQYSFGIAPPNLEYVAIFNDNDQTGEDASALIGAVRW